MKAFVEQQGNTMVTRWEVVATVAEPAPLLMAFVAHHLVAGASQVTLYLDDPDPETIRLLEAAEGCKVVQCDDNYWHRVGEHERPADHRVRQTVNANDAMARARSDWLIHLDADEFLIDGQEIAAELAGLGPDIEVAKVRNDERVFLRGQTPVTVFDGWARVPISNRQVCYAVYGPYTEFMRRGMVGHSNGKSFVRVGRGICVQIHGPSMPAKTAYLERMRLVHFDGLTRDHWIDKIYSKTITSSDTQEHRRTRARHKLVEFAAGPGLVREKMEQLYSGTMELPAWKAFLLRLVKRVSPIRMNICQEVADIYPSQVVDLSRRQFDHLLSARARVVRYRDAVFHVNLLENFTERLIALKRETREEEELEWLIGQFCGRSISFLDVGANIGLYSIILGMKVSPTSQIVAVECNPALLRRLRRNLAANGLDRVVVEEAALSDSNGTADLHIVTQGNLGEATLERSVCTATDHTMKVQTLTLLECMDLHGISQADFLKIDIEGHEPNVMEHFFETAARERFPRLVLMEMKHGAARVGELHSRMTSEGYEVVLRTMNNRIYRLGRSP